MTKLALLSDIHGNVDALRAVLGEARIIGVTQLLICGDITGYYYDTAAVWQEISPWETVICHGNHEKILADWINGDSDKKESIRLKYGSSYKITVETLDPASLQTLLSLKHPVATTIDNIRFLLSHGAPWDEDEYFYPDMDDERRSHFDRYKNDYDVILSGHTHYQMNFQRDKLQIINPGSVGQPRSGKEAIESDFARAQWALYDTSDRTCVLKTSYYNPSRIFKQVDLYDPHLPYLKKVLKRQELLS